MPWRTPVDSDRLRRWGRVWTLWTVGWTIPFMAAGIALIWIEPLALPVAIASFAHAWIIPELHAFRGASVLRRKGERHQRAEPVAQGFLGDLLNHDVRELQRETGLALERGSLGQWLVGEAGGVLVLPGGRRAHCFCVWTTDKSLPPSDRIAHLLLALRSDELGFATIANHAFSGAPWRVRRRMPREMRPALDRALAES
ncbi:MAG: hypothetical protein QOJ29_3471 [Thermoleophilaceae bacterium]|nr:hypothetical protein [Thermoleophilaceae bacterium]